MNLCEIQILSPCQGWEKMKTMHGGFASLWQREVGRDFMKIGFRLLVESPPASIACVNGRKKIAKEG